MPVVNRVKQVSSDSWAPRDTRPIAFLKSRATDLARRFHLRFEDDEDDLDFLRVAVIELPDGIRLGLFDRRRSPQKGIEVRADEDLHPAVALSSFLLATGLRDEALLWTTPLAVNASGPTNGETGLTLGSLIRKSDFYSLLRKRLGKKSDEIARLSTFFRGDLRLHDRPWNLHRKLFEGARLRRPVQWILIRNGETEGWIKELLVIGRGNPRLSVVTVDDVVDPVPTVQVVDELGLLYPMSPRDEALVIDAQEALRVWLAYHKRGAPALERGEPS